MNTLQAQLFVRTDGELSECPAWHPDLQRLSWVDIPNGLLHITDGDGRHVGTHQLERPIGLAIPAEDGGWLVGAGASVLHLAQDGSRSTVIANALSRAGIRFNDGACDDAGRAYLGTMALDLQTPLATLSRLESCPVVLNPVVSDLTISNGIGWSPDSSILYLIDTPRLSVMAFDYDLGTGALGKFEEWDVKGVEGKPDGLAVDEEGGIWIAFWGGGAVRRYGPGGALDRVISVPASRVSSCCFGGVGLEQLYITTAAPSDRSPHDLGGSLFVVEPGIAGRPRALWPLTPPSTDRAVDVHPRDDVEGLST